MITFIGERAILSNLKGNSFKITGFAIGTKAQKEDKNIEDLGLETLRKEPEYTYDEIDNKLEFKIHATGREVNGTNELGLFTQKDMHNPNGKLICYDTYDEISVPESSSITLAYTLNLFTEHTIKRWAAVNGRPKCYEARFPFEVQGVLEEGARSGYVKKENLDEVQATEASYFYNYQNNRIYIHCVGGVNPRTLSILVRSD